MNKEYDYCLRCGRKLKNLDARKIGYGTVCYKKMLSSRIIPPLFTLKKR